MPRPFRPVDESLFKTEPCITRYPETILSRHDVPYKSALTFNAGVLKRENGEYVMIFRNDIGDYDKVREDIFHADQVHLNPKGYYLFMDFVRELLDDLL